MFWQSKVFRILFDVIILNLRNSLLNFGPKFGIYGNLTTPKFCSEFLSFFLLNAFCSFMTHVSLKICEWVVNICLFFSKFIRSFFVIHKLTNNKMFFFLLNYFSFDFSLTFWIRLKLFTDKALSNVAKSGLLFINWNK